MDRAQLKALLSSGSSIVFDARARNPNPGTTQDSDAEKLPPFFEHALLRNVILMKSVGRAGPDNERADGLQTRLYVPFDSSQVANGGTSMVCGANFSVSTLERFFGVEKIDPARIDTDIKKIAVFSKTPSLSPFLLRDAFERASLQVDKRFFQISDAEAEALRDSLKAKLKPLAVMALNLSPTLVGNAQLDLLANKLWDLDDRRFLQPLAVAFKIPDDDTIDVFYAWIGVAYFQREFGKRQARLTQLAKWLVAKPPFPDGMKEEIVREYEEDRRQVRACVRIAWSSAGGIFERYTTSYDALVADGGGALPFVNYLQNVRADFVGLGADLSVVEQCLSFYDAVADQDRGSMQSVELLRAVARSMRGTGDSDSGRAAA
jgi:hypothetical protein